MTVGEKIERGYGGGVFVKGKLERMKGGGGDCRGNCCQIFSLSRYINFAVDIFDEWLYISILKYC